MPKKLLFEVDCTCPVTGRDITVKVKQWDYTPATMYARGGSGDPGDPEELDSDFDAFYLDEEGEETTEEPDMDNPKIWDAIWEALNDYTGGEY